MSRPAKTAASECAAQAAIPPPGGAWRLGELWRPGLALGIILVALCLVYFTPLRSLLIHREEACRQLRQLGWAGPAVFAAAVAPLVAVGVPRLILCAVGGLAFGFWQGLIWVQLGTLVGSYATFLFARWGGREVVVRRWPRLAQYERLMDNGGLWMVVLAKQIPINGMWTNCLLGVTRLRHRDFLLGTAIGIFPEAVPVTLVGAGAAQASFGNSAILVSIGIAILALLALAFQQFGRRARARMPEQP